MGMCDRYAESKVRRNNIPDDDERNLTSQDPSVTYLKNFQNDVQ